MKTNFKISKSQQSDSNDNLIQNKKSSGITQEEFEDFILQSGAVGSFMIFRSTKKEDELGLEEL
ncbi:MAG: hypothetical protein D4R72_05725 [Nitrosopumilales archaeon]|nr:MAG: hypothetical protein D4R72_05725 [Nitrosopumilales archaeon]